MSRTLSVRSLLIAVPTCASLLLLASAAYAQKAAGPSPFAKAVAEAKQSGKPLVVFGVSEGCHRCQALKEGLTKEAEIKELLTQYVAADVPFGGREFATIFDEIVRQDKSFNQSIGAPSVFIFTAKGAAVYAGPNRPAGMAADAEFKKLLQTGIEKNGPVRTKAAKASSKPQPASTPTLDLSGPPETTTAPLPRLWKSKSGKFSVTATLVSFDGVKAQLKTDAGKEVAVPLEALSAEDQQFLKKAAQDAGKLPGKE